MNLGKKEIGPEEKRFLSRVGRVNLGSEGLNEESAAKLNKIIDDINSGKDPGGLPEELIKKEEEMKEEWEKKLGGRG
ncbi:MAG: hypothetical protein NTZ49_04985 [Candidatus Parcubacteria bacterium]|nr:hypothetical protein [Candidatus Parcubacteria bacterium]